MYPCLLLEYSPELKIEYYENVSTRRCAEKIVRRKSLFDVLANGSVPRIVCLSRSELGSRSVGKSITYLLYTIVHVVSGFTPRVFLYDSSSGYRRQGDDCRSNVHRLCKCLYSYVSKVLDLNPQPILSLFSVER